MARRKSTLPVVRSQAVPSIRQSKKTNRPHRPRKFIGATRPKKLWTLAEAFSPFVVVNGEEGIDVERGLRSVAFLLHSLSDIGNADVEGFVAHGLACAIEHYADHVGAIAKRKGEI